MDRIENKEIQAEYANEVSEYTINDNVIAKIAKKVLTKTDGILELKKNVFSSIADNFTDGENTSGISIDVDDAKNAVVHTKIILEYGKKAQEVFASLDRNIKKEVYSLTGINVQAVKAEIVDVLTKEEYEEKNSKDKEEK
ncbi:MULTISPECIES: Asp23/Gls24 family envelope stress response protein [Anaerococcus]|uniref:Asp23/Gls24 family envelope stress response protein n=1 Tax=Anaerococcus obesiensis TaxID=1287640 RepID=A0A7T7UTN9_9FIRM|nr:MULTISPECIES: Asp23/Gls24 family envelope stress response protein [Anaerococcus]MBS6921098.1 Asp23/Gls24 family envelope stress response protein [Anaerococcus vaginalis]MDD7767158.1 Asp23/Gls24 family envelope stress response protein [Anaerococcus vaginalis]MDU1030841.1 Asp23/Gls24 family envelope stress response protein [Anaerococcus vaginalis]MDU1708093.1 Asp23/Gls24 family envelope stress response protein [Anaerococcus vaginalis]MDU1763064.1 Asp23/Gls24 family envelope stress response pr